MQHTVLVAASPPCEVWVYAKDGRQSSLARSVSTPPTALACGNTVLNPWEQQCTASSTQQVGTTGALTWIQVDLLDLLDLIDD